jgi:hypothetical protein
MMTMRSLFAVSMLAATPALAATIWTGDFETGDLSQWKAEMVSPDRLEVVKDPIRQGRFALKATVIQGDNPINASGNRNELLNPTPQPEGSESYYSWSTMFSPDYPSEYTWQVFTQWHQPEDCCGSPPVQFAIMGEDIQLTLSTAQTLVWHAPLVRGVWHDFILHVKFSNNPNTGFVELWYDGKKVLPKTYGATRANTYLKQGLYRNSSISQAGVVYHDAMIQGETLEDVSPGAQVASPSADGATPNSASNAAGLQGEGLNAKGGCAATGNSISILSLMALAMVCLFRRKPAAVRPGRN